MNCRIIDIHTHIYPVALARRAMEVTGHEMMTLRSFRSGKSAGADAGGGSGSLREPAGGIETTESGGGEPVREGNGKKEYYCFRQLTRTVRM
ncbi:MAG: hypothetical protein V8S37_03220 [Lachnospiraceae bacterium]